MDLTSTFLIGWQTITTQQIKDTLIKYFATPENVAIAAEMTEDGKIIRTLQDPSISAASQVSCSDDGFLYVGSIDSPFIRRLDMKKAGL